MSKIDCNNSKQVRIATVKLYKPANYTNIDTLPMEIDDTLTQTNKQTWLF